jgi:polygalacturonase
MFIPDLAGSNYLIEGVTIIEPNGYCLKVNDRYNGRVKNVKCLAYRYSTDGVGASYGPRSTVQNCFFKQNDDTIVLYSSNAFYEDVVLFAQANGASF